MASSRKRELKKIRNKAKYEACHANGGMFNYATSRCNKLVTKEQLYNKCHARDGYVFDMQTAKCRKIRNAPLTKQERAARKAARGSWEDQYKECHSRPGYVFDMHKHRCLKIK